MALFDRVICQDSGNAYRRRLGEVLPHMLDAYNDKEDSRRSHLGASVIGDICDRAIFFGFRWASAPKVRGSKREPKERGEARMRRLWNRGHLEEGRFIALLLTAGIHVYQQEPNGQQFRIHNLGGHFAGSLDSILVGVPDLPQGVPCLGEFKTHNDDSFDKLESEGLKIAKGQHYIQMQQYMAHKGLLYGLYMAVNKNDDRIYAEIIQIDMANATFFLERARRLIFVDNEAPLPARVDNAKPTFYICKGFCDHHAVCWGPDKPQRNCRTCQYISINQDGTFGCTFYHRNLNKQEQLMGCGEYRLGKIWQ